MADLTALSIDGAWLYQSNVFGDPRGYFTEWFQKDLLESELKREFSVKQANLSKSKRGVVRGIHFSIAKEGQAKWITCTSGAILDVVVDIRPNSPTFKKWISVELSAGSGKSIFMSEGLGHAFLALEDESTISYLLSSPYSPKDELGISPTDPDIGIIWPMSELHFSPKDQEAPSLADLLDTLKKSPHTGAN